MDPIEQMKLEEKRRAVEAAERRQGARDSLEDAVRARVPEQARRGSPVPLRFYPDEALDTGARQQVELFDRGLRQLAENMLFTMYATGGVGLAAPQVGEGWRLFVCDWSAERTHPAICVNPEITSASSELSVESEACLSMPGVRIPIERPNGVRARWRDEYGKLVEADLEGWAARIFQHELDHLEGMTIFDRTRTPMERRMALKRLEKVRRGVSPKKAKTKRKPPKGPRRRRR